MRFGLAVPAIGAAVKGAMVAAAAEGGEDGAA